MKKIKRRKRLRAEEVILIAVLSAVAAVGRIPFAALPSVQPTSFVIIMTGYVFGSKVGGLVGAIAALTSNIFLGQGPWTCWQMFCWGAMGASAGFFRNKTWMKTKLGKNIFGLVWGVLFGWIMNIWFVVGFFETISWKLLLSAGITSFYFDVAHGICNMFFLSMFGEKWIKIFKRVQIKYDLLKDNS